MTASLPGDSEALRERAKLAKKSAYLLSTRTFVPLSQTELERRLLGLVERLCSGMYSEGAARHIGIEVGTALVDLNCTTPEALQCSIEVIGKGMLGMGSLRRSDGHQDRVVEVVAALTAGYVEQIRRTTMEQQEQLGRSLYRAMRQAQLELQLSESRFDAVEGYSSTGIATTDLAGKLLRTNGALARIVDRGAAELARLTLFDLVHPAERVGVRDDYAQLERGGTTSITQPRRLLRADDEVAWVTLTLSPLRRPDGSTHVIVMAEDDTDVNLLQGQLNHQALHDVLTRLPNRQYFTSRLERALRTCDPTTGISVYHLDLDGFSRVTGGLGRHFGDLLLRTVANRLQEVVADEKAMVARFGYDEFAVLVENSPSTPDVVTMVRLINDRLAEPMDAFGESVATSATIGVVHRPPADASPLDLLDSADLTLRRAKHNGRRQWELADPAQDARERREFGLAATMTAAWHDDELSARYRPVVSLADESTAAMEARLRWDHPKIGAVPHEQCLALAEDIGLAVPLGTWLLGQACAQAVAWRTELDRDLPVRVCLTASEATDQELLGSVLGTVTRSGLPPSSLWLAMPASAVFGDREEAADNVRLLAENGIGVEIDGFTAAPADLPVVLGLPVRGVRLAPITPPTTVVAATLTSALKVLRDGGIEVSVTGVATPGQRRWWADLGADTASGPLFAP
ncbi:diguanylate cyclase [Saccharothrix violaceirubra]|uniref:Diguanylate cyclase (GGDEF)-like protein/PAS domain S-box-containing protein n=1 Tax=Saccharothrix violaceirubra TaxID=413306 RepID=A0A7W7T2E0_9PSEU|nr:EAL domain-containing protein [Saccharothrix violaceirubra]MBB4965278.1 diguanylate cyclase (GGDEF)-like protein/PAS domain S-box-containing protein [Saccharothrix violaceirubra]